VEEVVAVVSLVLEKLLLPDEVAVVANSCKINSTY
jgi:hypothetical protein